MVCRQVLGRARRKAWTRTCLCGHEGCPKSCAACKRKTRPVAIENMDRLCAHLKVVYKSRRIRVRIVIGGYEKLNLTRNHLLYSSCPESKMKVSTLAHTVCWCFSQQVLDVAKKSNRVQCLANCRARFNIRRAGTLVRQTFHLRG